MCSDVRLVVGGVSIPAHRLLLSLRSPVFRVRLVLVLVLVLAATPFDASTRVLAQAMFSTGMVESRPDGDVVVDGIEPFIFRRLLQ